MQEATGVADRLQSRLLVCYMLDMRPAIDTIARPLSLRAQALEQIRRAVVTGALAPGTMHSEKMIAESMGISRTPVREALLQLSNEGLVEFMPQRGVRITVPDPRHLAEVNMLREALDSYCAAEVARRRDPALIAALEREIERQRAIVEHDDRLAWIESNLAFHGMIVRGVSNRLMNDVLQPIESHMTRVGYQIVQEQPRRIPEILDEHAAIVEAIKDGDAEAARARTQAHLQASTAATMRLLMDRGQDDEEAAAPRATAGGQR